MPKLFIDHIVVSVKDLKKSVKFYSAFLGKARISKFDAHWQIGDTKLFLTSAYKKSPRAFDKHNLGLNHLAFGLKKLSDLKEMAQKLDRVKIKHSGIIKNKYSGKEYVWFDDPDKIRLEFYLRN